MADIPSEAEPTTEQIEAERKRWMVCTRCGLITCSCRVPVNVLHLTEVLPPGWQPAGIDSMFNAGRVIRVTIPGRPEQVATVGMGSSDGWWRVYLPDTDEYVDAIIEWAS